MASTALITAKSYAADGLGREDPRKVGEKVLGLDPQLKLYQACANFYVLESLHDELFPWDGDARFRKGAFPQEYGSDTRAERRAYSVQTSLVDLERKLADQFATYVSAACGGELRHFRKWDQGYYTAECTHKHSFRCCLHDYCRNCTRRLMIQSGKVKPRCVAHDCSSCKHKHSKSCLKGLKKIEAPERVQRYLEEVWSHEASMYLGKRSFGWGVWHSMYQEDKAAWMADCAKAFMSPIWVARNEYSGVLHVVPINGVGEPVLVIDKEKLDELLDNVGYGGKKWAVAAALCADYYAGKMSPRTFVDRCWSIQHNGGSIFDKFFKLPLRIEGGRRIKEDFLMWVLQTQAENDYESLATQACTDYVRSLWEQHSLATGKVTLDRLVSIRAKAVSDKDSSSLSGPGWSENVGCAACFAHWENTGIDDPCFYGDIDSSNSGCAYYEPGEDDDHDYCSDCGDCITCGDCPGEHSNDMA